MRRQIQPQLSLRLAEGQEARPVATQIRRKHDIEGRTEPAHWVDMICVASPRLQADGPCAAEGNLLGPLSKERMPLINGRQLCGMLQDCLFDRFAQRDDFGLDALEQVPVGLGASANGLRKWLALCVWSLRSVAASASRGGRRSPMS